MKSHRLLMTKRNIQWANSCMEGWFVWFMIKGSEICLKVTISNLTTRATFCVAGVLLIDKRIQMQETYTRKYVPVTAIPFVISIQWLYNNILSFRI